MSSVKVKFRPSTLKGKQGVIYYQIIHNRLIRQIKTEYNVFENEWISEKSIVTTQDDSRSDYLLNINKRITWDLKRLQFIIKVLDDKKDSYTTDDIINKFKSSEYELTLFTFMQRVINQLKKAGRLRTSETYTSALNSFSTFCNKEDVLLEEIDANMIFMYESYLKNNGLMLNTTSFYMRILRAVYNRAIEEGLVTQSNPFKQVYTGIDKTIKRAVSLDEIKRIKNLKLESKSLDFARDMFMFSFYTRGMSYVDMAYLTSKNISNGMLIYQRRKTGRQLCIRWEECMQNIVDKYKDQTGYYLLPIIKDATIDPRKQYKYSLLYVDRNLKKIASMAQIENVLTSYVARHSWASIAKSRNVPLAVISEALGHESEETTNIYLSSLDNSLIDKANAQILKSIQ